MRSKYVLIRFNDNSFMLSDEDEILDDCFKYDVKKVVTVEQLNELYDKGTIYQPGGLE